MARSIEVLRTILPVLLVIVIGMYCRSRALISREGINALKNVVVNITLPAVLINAFATTKYTLMDVAVPLMVFAICLAAWFLGKVCGKMLKMNSRFVPFLTTGFEAGMLGYALFNMLYGSSHTAEFARIDLGQVLFVFTLYKSPVAHHYCHSSRRAARGHGAVSGTGSLRYQHDHRFLHGFCFGTHQHDHPSDHRIRSCL